MWNFVIPAVAALGAAALSSRGQHSANRVARDSAREQMQFQERMSSTAHQRQMADMRAAGINPILSAKYGGASVPSGAGYSAQNEMESLPAAVSSAAQMMYMKAQIENTKANTEVAHASAKRIEEETKLLPVQRAKEMATQPLYDMAGTLIRGGVHSAKQIDSGKLWDDIKWWLTPGARKVPGVPYSKK